MYHVHQPENEQTMQPTQHKIIQDESRFAARENFDKRIRLYSLYHRKNVKSKITGSRLPKLKTINLDKEVLAI